jgi:hypothetical protein
MLEGVYFGSPRKGKRKPCRLLVIEDSYLVPLCGRDNLRHQVFGANVKPLAHKTSCLVVGKNLLFKFEGHDAAKRPPVTPYLGGLPEAGLETLASLIRIFRYADLRRASLKGPVDVDRVKLLKGRGLLAVTSCFFAPMTLRHLT